MKDEVKVERMMTPMLFPFEPDVFWQRLRLIVREEVLSMEKNNAAVAALQPPGFTQKPLYKIDEVCKLFQISRPTIYDWIRHGKLKPVKIRSRVFFLWDDLQQIFKSSI